MTLFKTLMSNRACGATSYSFILLIAFSVAGCSAGYMPSATMEKSERFQASGTVASAELMDYEGNDHSVVPASLSEETTRERDVAGKSPLNRNRMLIRNGSLNVSVKNISKAADQARDVVKAHDGYIASEREDEDDIWMTLRIPAENLDQTLFELAKLGQVSRKHLDSNDVTEQYLDMDAKLKNLVALRDRLQTLLDRANSVKDVLSVEQQLTRVQTQIDQLTGKLKSLRSRVAHSRIHLNIEKKRMDGPVTALFKGGYWVIEKLFVID